MMKIKRFLCIVCVLMFIAALIPTTASSATASNDLTYTNPVTGYRAEIRDDLGLIKAEKKRSLLDSMIPLTEFGHVGFCSTNQSASNALEQARSFRKNMFGMDSGSVFVINMKERQLNIQSYGTIYQYVTSSKAKSITDNVKNYATKGDYYTAASNAYQQMLSVINGDKIAEPMRYFSYAAIMLMAGMIIAIVVVFLTRFNPNIRKQPIQL